MHMMKDAGTSMQQVKSAVQTSKHSKLTCSNAADCAGNLRQQDAMLGRSHLQAASGTALW